MKMTAIPLPATHSAAAAPQVRPRVLVASMVGLWLCYFALTSARAAIVGLDFETAMLWRRAVVTAAGVGVTVLLWLVLRLVDHRPLAIKIAVALVAAMPAALLIAQVNQWVFEPIEAEAVRKLGEQRGVALRQDPAGAIFVDIAPQAADEVAQALDPAAARRSVLVLPAPTRADRWTDLLDTATSRYFVLLAWSAVYFALLAVELARAAERRGERFRSAAEAAELRSLRYQVNPHFLFNTLNSLSALVMTGKGERAEAMIQTMARFYRHSLAEDPTSDVALVDEIALQREYLGIEAVRFPERLLVSVDLPEALEGVRVPGMILQPLVENSVKYGVSASTSPVTITISAVREGDALVLCVADDGPGVDAGARPARAGLGIGLANVRDRLGARYGPAARLEHGPAPGGGHRSCLRLPLTAAGTAHG